MIPPRLLQIPILLQNGVGKFESNAFRKKLYTYTQDGYLPEMARTILVQRSFGNSKTASSKGCCDPLMHCVKPSLERGLCDSWIKRIFLLWMWLRSWAFSRTISLRFRIWWNIFPIQFLNGFLFKFWYKVIGNPSWSRL